MTQPTASERRAQVARLAAEFSMIALDFGDGDVISAHAGELAQAALNWHDTEVARLRAAEATVALLAERMAIHADCETHRPSRPDPLCGYCEDVAVYAAYLATGGKDYRHMPSTRREVNVFDVPLTKASGEVSQ